MRVVTYVDGMNFYEISKQQQWYPAGWCNWTETIRNYCPGSQVEVRYFTTKMIGGSKSRRQRQELHLHAMRTVAKAEIICGEQVRRDLTCPDCKTAIRCRCGCEQRYTEKQTDVNIALRILEDAIYEDFDRAYLVSADTDLIPALLAGLRRSVKTRFFVLRPQQIWRTDLFHEMAQRFPNRISVQDLELRHLVRFPEQIAAELGMPFPRHWRLGAGNRPANPDLIEKSEPPKKRPASWAQESVGFGTGSKKVR